MSNFKLPNAIILDHGLSYTAKKVCAIIYASRLFNSRLSVYIISKRARLSEDTVYTALNALEQYGYVVRIKNYEYSQKLQRVVWGRNCYLCKLEVYKDFTFVDYRYFKLDVSAGAFVLLMLLKYTAGNSSRAFPSHARIHNLLGMSKSWIHECLKVLSLVNALHIEHCVKESGCFANNSYFFLKTATDIGLECSFIAPCDVIISSMRQKSNIVG